MHVNLGEGNVPERGLVRTVPWLVWLPWPNIEESHTLILVITPIPGLRFVRLARTPNLHSALPGQREYFSPTRWLNRSNSWLHPFRMWAARGLVAPLGPRFIATGSHSPCVHIVVQSCKQSKKNRAPQLLPGTAHPGACSGLSRRGARPCELCVRYSAHELCTAAIDRAAFVALPVSRDIQRQINAQRVCCCYVGVCSCHLKKH